MTIEKFTKRIYELVGKKIVPTGSRAFGVSTQDSDYDYIATADTCKLFRTDPEISKIPSCNLKEQFENVYEDLHDNIKYTLPCGAVFNILFLHDAEPFPGKNITEYENWVTCTNIFKLVLEVEKQTGLCGFKNHIENKNNRVALFKKLRARDAEYSCLLQKIEDLDD